MTDPTLRFSTRAETYSKYRPRYPAAVLETLREESRLTNTSVIADIGSGTGILTELFLRNGNSVFAVEPNHEMREAGERLLCSYPGFHSVAGTAEASALPDGSVDFVTAGQAFHWFDREKTRRECLRILRPDGCVMLVWNERDTSSTPFLAAYEQLLLCYGTDYRQAGHRQIDPQALANFFGPRGYSSKTCGHRQEFDYAGLEGRLLSSSYTPEAGRPGHDAMLAELSEVFQAHQVKGRVTFEYVTKMYYGRLT